MSTNLINENETPDFDLLFNFSSEDEENKHEARMIMYRFLSEIERVSGKKRGLKKRLADAIGKSKSFITQLFNGDKLINLSMLAKFQKSLGIKFKIIAYSADEFDSFSAHQPQFAVNVFVTMDKYPSTEGIKAESNAHVQVIPQSNNRYS